MKIRNVLATALLVIGGGAGLVAIDDPSLPVDVVAAYAVSVNGEGSPLALLKEQRGTSKFASERGIFDIEHPSETDIGILKGYLPETAGAQECLILLMSDDKADCFTPTEQWEQFDRAE